MLSSSLSVCAVCTKYNVCAFLRRDRLRGYAIGSTRKSLNLDIGTMCSNCYTIGAVFRLRYALYKSKDDWTLKTILITQAYMALWLMFRI